MLIGNASRTSASVAIGSLTIEAECLRMQQRVDLRPRRFRPIYPLPRPQVNSSLQGQSL